MVIGLTGGVGAGKSTVVDIMRKHYPVAYIHCDQIGHEVCEPGKQAYREIVEHFGREILAEDGTIHRGRLYEKAFPTGRISELNSYIHPRVREEVLARLQSLNEEGFHGFVLIEAALLIEAGYRDLCDEFWFVSASEKSRKKRLAENRGYSKEKTEGIMKNQSSEEYYRDNCDFILHNDTSFDEMEVNIIRQIQEHLRKEGRTIE